LFDMHIEMLITLAWYSENCLLPKRTWGTVKGVIELPRVVENERETFPRKWFGFFLYLHLKQDFADTLLTCKVFHV
jgi:hypothetical protein